MVPAISLAFIQIIWKLANCFYNYRVSVKYPCQHHLRSSVLSPNDLQLRLFLILVILKTLAKFLDNWLKWSQIYEFFFLFFQLHYVIYGPARNCKGSPFCQLRYWACPSSWQLLTPVCLQAHRRKVDDIFAISFFIFFPLTFPNSVITYLFICIWPEAIDANYQIHWFLRSTLLSAFRYYFSNDQHKMPE